MKGALILIACFAVILLEVAATDPECTEYDNPDYGCVGQCISTSSCPGDKYISNLCPSFGATIKCCFTADSDVECATYDKPIDGDVGQCINQVQCPGANYISNLCPTKPNEVKCCFSHPIDTCPATEPNPDCINDCGITSKNLATSIRDHARVTLSTSHPGSSVGADGATAYNNIHEMAAGCPAKRSSHTCAQGTAPGGSVCISHSVLNYILGLADDGHYITVESLVGGCHGKDSLHYLGLAVDLDSTASHSIFMTRCDAAGASEMTGPGYPGSDAYVHCGFNS